MVRKTNEHYNSSMILHYYKANNYLNVVLDNGAIVSYPYSVQKEMDIINTIKYEIEELRKLEKRCKKYNNMLFGGQVLTTGLFAAGALALMFKGVNTRGLLELTGTATVGSGLGVLYFMNRQVEANNKLDEIRKYIFYLLHHKEVYDALTKQFHLAYGDDAIVSDINAFNVKSLDKYSLEDLESITNLRLEKSK